jgi:hypothetical protein
MQAFICATCGTQYEPSAAPPTRCAICTEERQFVLPTGQIWTTLDQLTLTHLTSFRMDAELVGVSASPAFAIGQRALLVRTQAGNVLWDCISRLDAATITLINALGGLSAIAISHLHYYTTMLEWSRAFGDVPVHLHAADREWVMRDGPALAFWTGETKQIAPGLTLIRCPGHFDGGQLLHWAHGAGGRGALLAGDLLQVLTDQAHVGFMRSYPNFIPLGAAAVRRIAAIVEPWSYDSIYGAFWDRVIPCGGKAAVAASVARHIAWLERDA